MRSANTVRDVAAGPVSQTTALNPIGKPLIPACKCHKMKREFSKDIKSDLKILKQIAYN